MFAAFGQAKRRVVSPVGKVEIAAGGAIIAYTVQYVDKLLVLLTVYLFQFDIQQGKIGKHLCMEKKTATDNDV